MLIIGGSLVVVGIALWVYGIARNVDLPYAQGNPHQHAVPLDLEVSRPPDVTAESPDHTPMDVGGGVVAADLPSGDSTWNPPPGGYVDLSIGGPGDGLHIAVDNAQLVAIVTVLDVGPEYWNAETNTWWVADPHANPDEDPLPMLGRNVTVRLEHILSHKAAPPGANAASLPEPVEGEDFTIYVPGGIAEIPLTEGQVNEVQSYLGEHGQLSDGHNEGTISRYRYERMPSMALSEGERTIVFLVRESILWKGGPNRDMWIGVAGPVGSNWVLADGEVFSPLQPGKASTFADFAIRLDWLSEGRISRSWVGETSR